MGVWYDTSADMWSLACILFELLTGDLMFDPRYSPLLIIGCSIMLEPKA